MPRIPLPLSVTRALVPMDSAVPALIDDRRLLLRHVLTSAAHHSLIIFPSKVNSVKELSDDVLDKIDVRSSLQQLNNGEIVNLQSIRATFHATGEDDGTAPLPASERNTLPVSPSSKARKPKVPSSHAHAMQVAMSVDRSAWQKEEKNRVSTLKTPKSESNFVPIGMTSPITIPDHGFTPRPLGMERRKKELCSYETLICCLPGWGALLSNEELTTLKSTIRGQMGLSLSAWREVNTLIKMETIPGPDPPSSLSPDARPVYDVPWDLSYRGLVLSNRRPEDFENHGAFVDWIERQLNIYCYSLRIALQKDEFEYQWNGEFIHPAEVEKVLDAGEVLLGAARAVDSASDVFGMKARVTGSQTVDLLARSSTTIDTNPSLQAYGEAIQTWNTACQSLYTKLNIISSLTRMGKFRLQYPFSVRVEMLLCLTSRLYVDSDDGLLLHGRQAIDTLVDHMTLKLHLPSPILDACLFTDYGITYAKNWESPRSALEVSRMGVKLAHAANTLKQKLIQAEKLLPHVTAHAAQALVSSIPSSSLTSSSTMDVMMQRQVYSFVCCALSSVLGVLRSCIVAITCGDKILYNKENEKKQKNYGSDSDSEKDESSSDDGDDEHALSAMMRCYCAIRAIPQTWEMDDTYSGIMGWMERLSSCAPPNDLIGYCYELGRLVGDCIYEQQIQSANIPPDGMCGGGVDSMAINLALGGIMQQMEKLITFETSDSGLLCCLEIDLEAIIPGIGSSKGVTVATVVEGFAQGLADRLSANVPIWMESTTKDLKISEQLVRILKDVEKELRKLGAKRCPLADQAFAPMILTLVQTQRQRYEVFVEKAMRIDKWKPSRGIGRDADKNSDAFYSSSVVDIFTMLFESIGFFFSIGVRECVFSVALLEAECIDPILRKYARDMTLAIPDMPLPVLPALKKTPHSSLIARIANKEEDDQKAKKSTVAALGAGMMDLAPLCLRLSNLVYAHQRVRELRKEIILRMQDVCNEYPEDDALKLKTNEMKEKLFVEAWSPALSEQKDAEYRANIPPEDPLTPHAIGRPPLSSRSVLAHGGVSLSTSHSGLSQISARVTNQVNTAAMAQALREQGDGDGDDDIPMVEDLALLYTQAHRQQLWPQSATATIIYCIESVCDMIGKRIVYDHLYIPVIENLYVPFPSRRLKPILDELDNVLRVVKHSLSSIGYRPALLGVLRWTVHGLHRVIMNGGKSRIFPHGCHDLLYEDIVALQDYFMDASDEASVGSDADDLKCGGLPQDVTQREVSFLAMLVLTLHGDTSENLAKKYDMAPDVCGRVDSKGNILRVLLHRQDPVAIDFYNRWKDVYKKCLKHNPNLKGLWFM